MIDLGEIMFQSEELLSIWKKTVLVNTRKTAKDMQREASVGNFQARRSTVPSSFGSSRDLWRCNLSVV